MKRIAEALLAVNLIIIPDAVVTIASERPNILLVMADDQGWGDMGYQGHPVLQTPHFDAAATAGLRFDRFYAAAPVCSPTRGSVMTGRHPNRYGVFKWGYPIRPQEITIAEALTDAGYVTAHFGKWHLGSVRRNSPANPGRNGFGFWISAPNFFDNDPILSQLGTAVQFQGESSMVTVDCALAWMRKVKEQDQPFLAVVWFGSPHSPHRAIDEDRQLYAEYSEKLQNFYGEITGMDRAFGKLRDSIREWEIHDNTILWYFSDNGALRDVGTTGGYRGHKGRLYEGGLLVPSILEWPRRIKTPRVAQHRCNTSDVFPTLLELTGVRIPNQPPQDGVSLVPLLDNETDVRAKPMGFWDFATRGISTPSAAWMSELLEAQQDGRDLEPAESSQRAAELPDSLHAFEDFPGHSAWIDGDWKLHRRWNPDQGVSWELYDLKGDPHETTNLYDETPVDVDGLKADLKAWLTSVVASLGGSDYLSTDSSGQSNERLNSAR